MRQLDHGMRRRLGELARQERSPLGAVDRQRIVARAGELEPGARGAGLLLGAVLGAAALLMVWYLAPTTPDRWAAPTVAEDLQTTVQTTEQTTDVAVETDDEEHLEPRPGADEHVAVARPICAGDAVPAVAAPRPHGRNAEAIDVGQRARFVLFGEAEGRLETLRPCRTVFVLERGRVLVHARDLRGGELVVRTAEADVSVHGTVFDVQLEPGTDGLRVAVAEGKVGVTPRADDREAALLIGGEVLDVLGGQAVLRALPETRARSLLAAVADRPRADAPRPRRVPRAEPAAEPEPPRGEVVGGVPQVHQPRWTSDP